MANLNTISVSSLNDFAEATNLDNFGTVGVVITGTWSGTLTFKGSLDGVNFVTILAQSISTNLFINSATNNGQFIINAAGMTSVRIEMTSYTSGTADIDIQGTSATSIDRSLSTIVGDTDGTTIGNVNDRLKVTGSFPSTPIDIVLNFSAHLENGGSLDANVDGSVTPVDFIEGPLAGEIWYVYELTFSIIDLGTMDADDFGTLNNLSAPGLEFFAKINSSEYRISRVRSNLEIATEFTSQNFTADSAAFLDDDDQFTGTQIWKVPTKLVGDNGDQIIMRVNDDLSNIDFMTARICYYKVL